MESNYYFILVDFDETLVDNGFPDIQQATIKWDVVKRIQKIINQLRDKGYVPILILNTCRSDNETGMYLSEAIDCIEKRIPLEFDYYNENPLCIYSNSLGKIFSNPCKLYADLYIDDKAVNLSRNPLEDLE